MTTVAQIEKKNQARVLALFRERPGYAYLDNRIASDNRTIEPGLLSAWLWQTPLHVSVAAWGIRRMRTKWGSCNPSARRGWINLQLAKKPEVCLEHIVVHELTHLHQRRHNERFTAILDTHMLQWRKYRDMLNRLPLAHEVGRIEAKYAGSTAGITAPDMAESLHQGYRG